MKNAAQNGPASALTGRKTRLKKAVEPQIIKDPIEAAEAAGLNYVHDDGPGIRRKKRGEKFSYIDLDGKPMRDRETLEPVFTSKDLRDCKDASKETGSVSQRLER